MSTVVFGQGAVQTAYESYAALDITANSLTLVWWRSNINVSYTDPNSGIHYHVLAAYMDVKTGLANTHTITLPDATQSSVGYNFIITNTGQSNFDLKDADGNTIHVIEPTVNANSHYVILTDTSTKAGTWYVMIFGAGTSEANASALAGLGLRALGNTLNTQTPVFRTAGPLPSPLTDAYRASLIVWTGNTTTITLPNAGAGFLPGFPVAFNNQGAAPITITAPGTTIDGDVTQEIQINQSLTAIWDGTVWSTLGFGHNDFPVITKLALNVSASTDITLTELQASNLVQEYFGALTADITITFPNAANYWFVNNITTGGFTITVRIASGGSTYVIPSGTTQMIYSGGNNMHLLPNAIQLVDGAASKPSISFLNSPNTGMFRDPGTDTISIVNNNGGSSQFVTAGVESALLLFPPSITEVLGLSATNINASIGYNSISSIAIDLTGQVSLPAAPLEIASGGTGATTAAGAIFNLMPTPSSPGDMVYWDGLIWKIIPVGTPGQTLKLVGAVPTWQP